MCTADEGVWLGISMDIMPYGVMSLIFFYAQVKAEIAICLSLQMVERMVVNSEKISSLENTTG